MALDTFMDYMQIMYYVAFMLICAPILAIVISGREAISTKRNNTMQRNSIKGCHTLSSKLHNYMNDTSESGISANDNHQGCTSASGKHHKLRNANQKHDMTRNNTITQAATDKRLRRSAGFKCNNWLQNDLSYHERDFMSSWLEGKMASCHNRAHRSSTSSEAGGNNCSSNNEDMGSTYLVHINSSKKATKSRQKKHQKRKQHSTTINTTNINTNVQPKDAEKKTVENVKPIGVKQTSNNAALNLRKQCTNAAALKTLLNNSKTSKPYIHDLSTLESNSSVRSPLSSASSTTSINSSSASSSPTNSVNSSPTASPTVFKKKNTKSLIPPLREFTKLNMNEPELAQQMRRYVIDPSLLRVYGFPVESVHDESSVEIFKCLPKHLAEEAVTKDNQRHHCHFYGRKKSDIINIDSGRGSGESSPGFTDSDSSEMGEDAIVPIMAFYTPDGVYQIFSEYCNSMEKQCVRCSKMFQVNEEGEYLSFDSCSYHWGKLSNVYNGKCYINIYSCCQGEELSEGCSQHTLHVWNGAVVGINGPYTDFVHTQHRYAKHHNNSKVYAIDCEMSYTGLGLEVTKVTVVGYDGSMVYEHFVRTQVEVIDYNTRFSGVSENDLLADSTNCIKTFDEVQHDLLNLFDADTILIGHGLDNDLRVLRLVHKTIVDTSLIFTHSTGFPYRRSLKNLTKSFLKRDIQCGNMGHSSFEDSRACLELMMWKLRKDLRHWNYQ